MSNFQEYSISMIFFRLFSNHIKPQLKLIITAITFMIIAAICSALIVKLVEPTINEIFMTHNKKMLIILPLQIIFIYTIKGISEYYQAYLIKYVGHKILTKIQIKMYEHLLFSDLNFIESNSSGKLISRFTNDIILMRGAVSNLLIGCAKHLITVLFLIVIMFQLEPTLFITVFIIFPLAIYPIQKLGKRMRKVSNQVQEELGNYTARLDETFKSIKIIKSFSNEQLEINKALSVAERILKFYQKASKLEALTSPIMEILCGIAAAFIISYGGFLVIENKTTTGTLLAFVSAFITTYRPFKSLLALNVSLQDGIIAARRVFYIFDTVPIIVNKNGSKDITLINPSICFQNISLNVNNKNVLRDINCQIDKGAVCAIVGPSGSGKTSLISLLVRFIECNKGQILLNDNNINDFTIKSLRNSISLVTQDTLLFDANVFENIKYGKLNSSLDEVIEASKYANAHDFISLLPNGYYTNIGSHGINLSGGQKQRIAISRAFLKQAPILVLDEATSGLDFYSERIILESIKNLKNTTTLIITHRLSSIAWVDQIIVIDNGKIVEQGKYHELLCNKGIFYQLCNKELVQKSVNL